MKTDPPITADLPRTPEQNTQCEHQPGEKGFHRGTIAGSNLFPSRGKQQNKSKTTETTLTNNKQQTNNTAASNLKSQIKTSPHLERAHRVPQCDISLTSTRENNTQNLETAPHNGQGNILPRDISRDLPP